MEPPSALDLRLNGSLPAFVSNAEALASGADVLFLCLDHDEAAAIKPPANAVVVDLSGGHRLRDAALYDDWYGFAHPFPGALTEWSYAVPELYPPTTRLIASLTSCPNQCAAATRASPPRNQPMVLKCSSIGTSLLVDPAILLSASANASNGLTINRWTRTP